jgi:hypothetical protein
MIRQAIVISAITLGVTAIFGCKSNPQPQPQQVQPNYGTPYGTGYGTPTATAPPTAAPVATMGQPAPYSPPCQQEGTCGWAHCNIPAGRCAYPCYSNADCIPGAQCMGMPGTPLAACAQFSMPGAPVSQ